MSTHGQATPSGSDTPRGASLAHPSALARFALNIPDGGWPDRRDDARWCELRLAGGDYVALLDAGDYERVSAREWRPSIRKHVVYARCGDEYLHRFVMDAPKGTEVDHVNGNGLDCRRANLRYATRAQNCANHHRPSAGETSRYRGVYWRPGTKASKTGFWVARVRVNLRVRQTYHHDEVAAAASYNQLAKEAYGEFAWVNVIDVFCGECDAYSNHSTAMHREAQAETPEEY